MEMSLEEFIKQRKITHRKKLYESVDAIECDVDEEFEKYLLEEGVYAKETAELPEEQKKLERDNNEDENDDDDDDDDDDDNGEVAEPARSWRQTRNYITYDKPNAIDEDVNMAQNIEDDAHQPVNKVPVLYTRNFDLRQKLLKRESAKKKTNTILLTISNENAPSKVRKSYKNYGLNKGSFGYNVNPLSNVQKRLSVPYQAQKNLPFSERIHTVYNAEEICNQPLDPNAAQIAGIMPLPNVLKRAQSMSSLRASTHSLAGKRARSSASTSADSDAERTELRPTIPANAVPIIAGYIFDEIFKMFEVDSTSTQIKPHHEVEYNLAIQKEIAQIQDKTRSIGCEFRKPKDNMPCLVEPDTTGFAINNRFSMTK